MDNIARVIINKKTIPIISTFENLNLLFEIKTRIKKANMIEKIADLLLEIMKLMM